MSDENVTEVVDSQEPIEDAGPTINQDDRKESFIQRKVRESTIISDVTTMTELQFVAINDHFDHLLEQSELDENLRELGPEISYLLSKFRIMYSIQRRLMHKVSEMQAQVNMHDREKEDCLSKVKEREDEIKSLESRIEHLSETLRDSTRQKDEALEEALAAREEVRQLQNKTVEASTPVVDSSSQRKEVMQLREEMIEQRNQLEFEISELKKQLELKGAENITFQHDLKVSSKNLKKYESDIAALQNEHQIEVKRRAKIDREMLEIRKDVREKVDTIKHLNTQLNDAQWNLETVNNKARRYEEESRKYKKDLDELSRTFEKLKLEFEVRGDKLTTVLSEKEGVQTELRTKFTEVRNLKHDVSSLKKEKFTTIKRVASLESYKFQAEDKMQLLKRDKISLEKELEDSLKQHRKYEKEISDLQKEKELMSAKILKSENIVNQLNNQIKVKDEAKKVLYVQLTAALSNFEREKQRLNECEAERNRITTEMRSLLKKIGEQKEEITLCEKKIEKFQKELASCERKLKSGEELRHEMFDDLTKCKKALKEAKDEVAKGKEKTASSYNYIELLKENIRSQEAERITLTGEINKLQVEISSFRTQLAKQASVVAETHSDVQKRDQQIQTLLKDMSTKDKSMERLKKDLVNMTEDRNLLTSLLTNKEIELDKLREKLKIQEMDMNKKDEENQRHVNDIKLLKSELLQMSRSHGLLRQKVSNFETMKVELIQTKQQLMQESLKCKAMEVDTRKPVSIHRMKVLAGSDPDKHQLLLKAEAMQKKLVKKDVELDLLSSELEEYKKVVDDLRDRLRKQPSSDVFSQLSVYKSQCRKLKDKCDSLTAQVNMYQSYCANFKQENVELKEKLNNFKTAEYIRNLKTRAACA